MQNRSSILLRMLACLVSIGLIVLAVAFEPVAEAARPAALPTATPMLPTATPVSPTAQPTDPPAQPSATPAVIPTFTPLPAVHHKRTPTATLVPPTETAVPYLTNIRLTKVASATEVNAGDRVVFTLQATNTGSVTAYDVVVTDPIPVGLTVVDLHSGQGDIAITNRTVTAYVSTLAAGQTVAIQITVTVNRDAPATMTNVATITTTTNGDDPQDNTGQATLTHMPVRLPHTADEDITSPLQQAPFWLPWSLIGLLLIGLGAAMAIALNRRRPAVLSSTGSAEVAVEQRGIRRMHGARRTALPATPLSPPQLGPALPTAGPPAPLPPLVPLDRDAALRDALPEEDA